MLTTNRPVGSWGEILDDTTVAAALLDLSGADLSGAFHLDQHHMTDVHYDENTRWPTNFKPPPSTELGATVRDSGHVIALDAAAMAAASSGRGHRRKERIRDRRGRLCASENDG